MIQDNNHPLNFASPLLSSSSNSIIIKSSFNQIIKEGGWSRGGVRRSVDDNR